MASLLYRLGLTAARRQNPKLPLKRTKLTVATKKAGAQVSRRDQLGGRDARNPGRQNREPARSSERMKVEHRDPALSRKRAG